VTTLFTKTALFAEKHTCNSQIYLLNVVAGIIHTWDDLRRSLVDDLRKSLVSGKLRTGDWSKTKNYNPLTAA